MVAHDVSWAAHTGKHLLRTQNASEQNQKHFLPPRHKICVRNKCCARGQTGKHLCRQQCVRNNLSSFALPVKSKLQHPPSPGRKAVQMPPPSGKLPDYCFNFSEASMMLLKLCMFKHGLLDNTQSYMPRDSGHQR